MGELIGFGCGLLAGLTIALVVALKLQHAQEKIAWLIRHMDELRADAHEGKPSNGRRRTMWG